MIRDCIPADANKIAAIYNHYVANTVVSFEEEPISPQTMAQRIDAITPNYPWLVYLEQEKILGYAYASAWKTRHAYRHSVETSIYMDIEGTGKGWGTRLYQALLQRLLELPVHSVIGGIALPNQASIRLHEKLGFEKVAHFKEVGRKLDRWVDVAYWELIL
jgi:L-amino acid N-acyltransferase YncA